jgi:hypothetical protein
MSLKQYLLNIKKYGIKQNNKVLYESKIIIYILKKIGILCFGMRKQNV